MTLAELLGISVVHHADKNTVGLVLGEEERDITEELRTHGAIRPPGNRTERLMLSG